MDWRCGDQGFLSNKKKTRKKERGRPEKRRKLHPFLLYPILCSHMFYSLVFDRHAKLSYFS